MDARITMAGRDPKFWPSLDALSEWGLDETVSEASSSISQHIYTQPDQSSSTTNQTRFGSVSHSNGSTLVPSTTSPITAKYSLPLSYAQLIEDYSEDCSELNNQVFLALDKFKFEIIASNLMSSAGTPASSAAAQTKVRINVCDVPSHRLVHSHRAFHLALALLHFARRNLDRISPACLKLATLLATAILVLDLNTKKIAIRIYLQLVTNKLDKFLQINHQLDRTLSSHVRTFTNLANDNLNVLLGGNAQSRRVASPILLQGVLNTLLATTNQKVAAMLPFADLEYLHRYLDVYQLDLGSQDLRFVGVLNSEGLADGPGPVPLKPLRLRSFSSDSPLQHSPTFPQPKAAPPPPLQLASSPSRTFQCFKYLRKIFLCVLLAIAENARVARTDETAQFARLCARKFNVPLASHHLTLPTKLVLMSQVLQQLIALQQSLQQEVAAANEGPPVAEMEVSSPEEQSRYKGLIGKLDSISNRLSAMELNETDSVENLTQVGASINELVDLYNATIDGLKDADVSVRATPVSSPQLANREFPPPKKRHSSGLNFNLITVFEDQAETKDVVHTEHGVAELGPAEQIPGVQSKEDLKKTLEKLCAGELRETNETFECRENDGSLSTSTPIKSEEMDIFKKELKGLLMNAL
ncbi:hypothetical protein KL942_004589 [Ogataea angusta]|uniref:Uncharacterized protein n=1 Tax=Pichia angusta TaxID=870730 RepID=A0ABQ7RS17_PICAN|nr:hypothetical protein KL920_005072 [Ogataea angusta]KAG7836671.1 hypothetical protein KL942_004589 [Ogataea angusta]KAG7846363.1 hypothetical protein KL940_004315 [Ogataea angusta]